jgi:hypothetical protein
MGTSVLATWLSLSLPPVTAGPRDPRSLAAGKATVLAASLRSMAKIVAEPSVIVEPALK